MFKKCHTGIFKKCSSGLIGKEIYPTGGQWAVLGHGQGMWFHHSNKPLRGGKVVIVHPGGIGTQCRLSSNSLALFSTIEMLISQLILFITNY